TIFIMKALHPQLNEPPAPLCHCRWIQVKLFCYGLIIDAACRCRGTVKTSSERSNQNQQS
ncbi:MAG: hypothetical protein WCS96_15090, partial [Victivallales bacterium]